MTWVKNSSHKKKVPTSYSPQPSEQRGQKLYFKVTGECDGVDTLSKTSSRNEAAVQLVNQRIRKCEFIAQKLFSLWTESCFENDTILDFSLCFDNQL